MASMEASPRILRREDSSGLSLKPSPNSSVHGGDTAILFAIDEEVKEWEANGWEYSAYRIVTTYQSQMYTATRRFKEFTQLHLQLRAHLPPCRRSFPWVAGSTSSTALRPT